MSNANTVGLEVKNLWKIFGPKAGSIIGSADEGLSRAEMKEKTGCVVGVRDVSFDVAPGEVFVVMGLSGSGKSTLIKCVNGLERIDSGTISITGGKLTTYREMAEDTVDAVAKQLGTVTRCRTAKLPLLGAKGHQAPRAGSAAAHLAGRYGSLTADVQALIAADPTLGEPLVPGMPYLRAEAVYAVRHEMALTLDDVLTRRTRARLHDRAATLAAAPAAAALLATELGWDAAATQRQLEHFVAQCTAEVAAAAAPNPGSKQPTTEAAS